MAFTDQELDTISIALAIAIKGFEETSKKSIPEERGVFEKQINKMKMLLKKLET